MESGKSQALVQHSVYKCLYHVCEDFSKQLLFWHATYPLGRVLSAEATVKEYLTIRSGGNMGQKKSGDFY